MIITRLQGGHSNQLFQYAVGRKLAMLRNTELLLDLTWFDDFADVDTPRFYELDVYPLVAKTTKLRGLPIIDPRQAVSKSDLWLRNHKLSRKVWMYYEPSHAFHPEVLGLPDRTMLVGFWQTEKYFADIRPRLLTEFEPTKLPSKHNRDLIKKIEATESVWMHVRRGDYVTNPHAKAFHGVKDKAYYQQAFGALLKKLPRDRHKEIAIFICSNDIPWCKQNLKFGYPVHFVENKLGSDDMRVVKHCKHDIIANSSFSWWGAWLNENPGKIVIAPKKWFLDAKTEREADIALKSWNRI